MPLMIFFGACSPDIQKTASGLEYVIYHKDNGKGPLAGSGSTVKLTLVLRKGDSVIRPARRMPEYKQLIPGLVFPYTPIEALYHVQAGDSIIAWQRVDSMVSKHMIASLPHGWKKSDKLTATMRVLAVFPFDYGKGNLVKADEEAETVRILAEEEKAGPARIQTYLTKHHIETETYPSGIFVEFIQKGDDQLPDSGETVSLRYTCSTLSGKVLDSNIDTSFHHPPVLNYMIGSDMIPPYIDKTIRLLPVGSHVKLYFSGIAAINREAAVQSGQLPTDDFTWDLLISRSSVKKR